MNTSSNVLNFPPRIASSSSNNKPASRKPVRSASDDDDLFKLALEIAQYDPVLAHLLARSGERRRKN